VTPKFCEGELVHNRITNEDGVVRGGYERNGVCMYRVFVPVALSSSIGGHHSDWEEDRLELPVCKPEESKSRVATQR
jgi:hypothetical protein